MTVAELPPETYTFRLPPGSDGDGAARLLQLDGLKYREAHGDNGNGALTSHGHTTGAAQWPAGLLMAEYLAYELGRKGLENKRIVEMGCGLGLCGLVAAATAGRGASVLLTDGDQGTVDRASANAGRNLRESDAATSFAVHLWGTPLPGEVQRCAHHPSLSLGDAAASPSGRQPAFGVGSAPVADASWAGRTDVLIGADVVYAVNQVTALFASVALWLAPDGAFILGFQRRSVSLQAIRDAAAAVGLVSGPVSGDFCLDVFGHRMPERSQLWQVCLMEFRFAAGGAAEAARVAEEQALVDAISEEEGLFS